MMLFQLKLFPNWVCVNQMIQLRFFQMVPSIKKFTFKIHKASKTALENIKKTSSQIEFFG